ncbi:MAG TPA: hypothetical protein VI796_06810 [Candidatus Thermoplasmatota archaeon]|nr:hypothetical protein [Candidatus Thermoplasmatota archaeon]
MTVPVIPPWNAHVYGKLPAALKVKGKDCPWPRLPELKAPPLAVAVWAAESKLVQVTVEPVGMVRPCGLKAKPEMETAKAPGPCVGVGEEVVVVGGGAVVQGSVVVEGVVVVGGGVVAGGEVVGGGGVVEAGVVGAGDPLDGVAVGVTGADVVEAE